MRIMAEINGVWRPVSFDELCTLVRIEGGAFSQEYEEHLRPKDREPDGRIEMSHDAIVVDP